MLRDFLTGLCMLVAATGAFAADNALTGKTLIDGSGVTVGDLFTHTGRHAGYVLAPAPKVGETLTLTKQDLQRVAETFALDWKAPNDDISVSVQRNAVAVDGAKIAAALADSDLKSEASNDATFHVTSLTEPLVFQGLEEPEINVLDTAFDETTEKFVATIQVKRGDTVLQELNVKGNATPIVKVPVLRRTAMPNTIINAEDLTEMTLPKRDLRNNVFYSANDLIGMSAKRTLAAGQMIGKNDVTPPVMVKRNELITVVYQNGPVRLSTKARALDNGSKGDLVTLENTTSRKPFQAKITGPQQAEVLVDAI